ncbi:unnamed protein product, partial [Allacma fusca]
IKYFLVVLLASVAAAATTEVLSTSVRGTSAEHIHGHLQEHVAKVSPLKESPRRCAHAGMDCPGGKCCGDHLACEYSTIFDYYMCKVKNRS